MKIIEIECFEVYEVDGYSGHNNHLFYVSDEKTAWEVCRKDDNKSFHRFKKTFRIIDTAQEAEDFIMLEIRHTALSKLTDVEIQALRQFGLGEEKYNG